MAAEMNHINSAPVLRLRFQYGEHLIGLANQVAETVTVQLAGDFPMMASFYLFKQIDHMGSLLVLASEGLGTASMVVLARIMLEGMANLRWAEQDPTVRARLWTDHTAVHDFYEIQWMDSIGRPVPDDVRQRNEERLQTVGPQFYSPQAQRELRRGRPLPDRPYRNGWHEPSIRELMVEAGFGDLYHSLYRASSGIIHWGAGGVGRMLERGEDSASYRSWVPHDALMALSAGFQALLITVDIANRNLNLGQEAAIEAIGNTYVQDVSNL